MSLLEDVSLALQAGRAPKVKELVQQAVDEGCLLYTSYTLPAPARIRPPFLGKRGINHV